MSNGLRILRCIDPDRDLRNWLDGLNLITEIEDRQGKPSLYFDDATPLPMEIADGIRRCTLRFVIFDDDNNAHYVTTSAQKAAQALKQARPSFVTVVDVDDLPEAEPEDEGPDLPPEKGKR